MKPDTSTEAVKALAERLDSFTNLNNPGGKQLRLEAAELLRALAEERDVATWFAWEHWYKLALRAFDDDAERRELPRRTGSGYRVNSSNADS